MGQHSASMQGAAGHLADGVQWDHPWTNHQVWSVSLTTWDQLAVSCIAWQWKAPGWQQQQQQQQGWVRNSRSRSHMLSLQ
jgi:hypothetical protein